MKQKRAKIGFTGCAKAYIRSLQEEGNITQSASCFVVKAPKKLLNDYQSDKSYHNRCINRLLSLCIVYPIIAVTHHKNTNNTLIVKA